MNTFESFINHQTQIVLDLMQIYWCYGRLEDFVLEKQENWAGFGYFAIIVDVFDLFPNLQQIIIYTNGGSIYDENVTHGNPFPISRLLSSIEAKFSGNELRRISKLCSHTHNYMVIRMTTESYE